jgi:hypothetical protein
VCWNADKQLWDEIPFRFEIDEIIGPRRPKEKTPSFIRRTVEATSFGGAPESEQEASLEMTMQPFGIKMMTD